MVMGNRELAMAVVNWVIGEEASIAIGSKAMRASVLALSEAKFNAILATSFLGIEAVLLAGLFVWWRRRGNYAPVAP
jgi:hypothetical protein